jgi:hypothetical protein
MQDIKDDSDDEDDVKEAVVASDQSVLQETKKSGRDGGWISLPPEIQEQAQEIEAEDEN